MWSNCGVDFILVDFVNFRKVKELQDSDGIVTFNDKVHVMLMLIFLA